MLSEKAKGKQREIDLPLGQSSTSTSAPLHDSRDLTIRFTDGIPDLKLTVCLKDTVKDVKANVRFMQACFSIL